jgi:hypothetical protein
VSRNQTIKDNFHHEGTKDTKEEFSRKGARLPGRGQAKAAKEEKWHRKEFLNRR